MLYINNCISFRNKVCPQGIKLTPTALKNRLKLYHSTKISGSNETGLADKIVCCSVMNFMSRLF